MATVTKPIALDESFNTTEQTPRSIADVLAEELSAVATAIGGISAPSAEDVSYDNSGSGLSATDVQNALDEIVSDIPTVNDGTLTIQQNGETKGTFTANQSENSTVNIETPTTDIQTAVDEFETYNGGILSSLKVSLTPNQDLHGYDSPWVGGAGKNKFPLNLATIKANNTGGTWTGNIFAYNGGTVEIVTDNGGNITAIKLNGTFNVRTDIVLFRQTVFPSGQYKLNGVNNNGSAKWNLRIDRDDVQTQDNIAVVDGSPSLNDVTFTAPSTVVRGVIRIYAGITTDIIISPMIRVSTDTDPTFEPYTNECPISGHTQVDVDVSDGQTTQEQVTVNLGGTYYSGTLDVVSGELTVDSAFIASYNGETLPSTWISDRDVYAVGTTPTTGAEVCYKLATPTPIQLSPTMVKALVGENHLSAPLDGQDITESKYKQMFTFDDVIAYIQSLS